MIKDYFIAIFLHEPPEDVGEVHVAWKYPEFIKHERGKWWYVIIFIIIAALLIFSVVTMNFLFAVIVLLLTFIGIFQHFQIPQNIHVKIAEDGIIVRGRLLPFKDLQAFWFVYDPPMAKDLYIQFKSQTKRNLVIPLEDTNPLKVREILENYLVEDLEKEEESFTEVFSRVTKI